MILSARSSGGGVSLPDDGNEGQVLTKTEDSVEWGNLFHVGTTAPSNTKLLWVDTANGLKYYNGTAWVTVPVAYN